LRGIFVRKIASSVLVSLMITVLAGCNTVSGFGKDVQKLGRKMEEAADRRNR
jgi:entericidin A